MKAMGTTVLTGENDSISSRTQEGGFILAEFVAGVFLHRIVRHLKIRAPILSETVNGVVVRASETG